MLKYINKNLQVKYIGSNFKQSVYNVHLNLTTRTGYGHYRDSA